MPRRKHYGAGFSVPTGGKANGDGRRVLYLPYPECRRTEGDLRLDSGALARCGCRECLPSAWCTATDDKGERCTRTRSIEPEARKHALCDRHFAERFRFGSANVPVDFLRDVITKVYRAERRGVVLYGERGFSSLAGLIIRTYLPAAYRAGLIDAHGRPTFDIGQGGAE